MGYAVNLLEQPAEAARIAWPATMGRRFMLWVDTEEEFDWSAPFDRHARTVSVMAGMARFQKFIAQASVKPVYVIDHAVADSDAACDLMRQWLADGTADIGAHLHPWVNPPHDEEVNLANSYAGNLPAALERAKLLALRDRIVARLGIQPLAYRAGRYGIGANSAGLLEATGFRVDSSVRSRFDYRAQAGPDFRGRPLYPYRAGPSGKLIELPLSTAYAGYLGRWGEGVYPAVSRLGRLGGLLSRTGLLARIPLTPEGITARECCAAIDSLIAQDVPVLGFSFHSPTLEPGHTPYTRTSQDIEDFYRWWAVVLDHLARRSVTTLTLDALIAACA